jgi:hypothetical protein
MVWAFRLLSGLTLITAPYIWTVGQAGLETANRNICDLANSFVQLPSCKIHFIYLGIWIAGIILAAAFVAFDLARFVRRAATTHGGVLLFCRYYQGHFVHRVTRIRSKVEPHHVIITGLVIAALGVGWQIYRGSDGIRANATQPIVKNLDTHLNLKFGAPGTLPVEEGMSNIARWYALANVVVLVGQDGSRKELKFWNIFLAFEKPIDVRQVLIKSNDRLPPYEVKDFSTRSAVVAVTEDLANVSLSVVISASGSQTAAKPEPRA